MTFQPLFGIGNIDTHPSDWLRTQLEMPPTSSDVTLEYSSATRRYVWTPIINRLWTRWTLDLIATGLWKLNGAVVYDILSAWDSDDVSITYVGVWGSVASGLALGGDYRRSKIVGTTAQFTVSGSDKIYLVLSKLTNGGYANVTINGGTALVNELPLVGGNRQLNCYSSPNAPNSRVLIASSLNPATAYTVLITVTGTKQAESSDTYINLEGYGIFTTTINDGRVGTVLNDGYPSIQYGYAGSENEPVMDYLPTGASLYEWCGSGHGNENIISVQWLDWLGWDESVSVVMPKNNAAAIVVKQSGTSRHGETGVTDHANVEYVHTFDSRGLTIYCKHTWINAASVRWAYAGMWAFRNEINRGHVAGDTNQIYNLAGDDDRWLGQKRTRLAALWDATNPYVAWLYLPDEDGVNSWINSINYAFIEDRSGTLINKIYFQRIGAGSPVNVLPSDVWEETAHYRVSYIVNPDTAINWV